MEIPANFHCTVRLAKGRKITLAGMTASTGSAPRPLILGNDSPEHTQRGWRKDVRVLVIEDNATTQTVVNAQLRILGYTVKIVEDAQRGLIALFQGHYDIVLMDCDMPGMDGYAATAEIRQREGNARHTVVIALTAHAAQGDRERCLSAGMDDYISKPVKLEALTEALGRWAHPKSNAGATGHAPALAKH